ncbi:hypothetical protein C7B62_06640 [Pleurocapsa sp. CCALA 161]|uniref:hypothetical protein n=1 Tax=Pleurocapsa sp. CCALA 161 TaxID=2107688 RepID=UPI000D0702BE|nr:hypothetical protein [Pleurocapsa sp. CCALA 161]PSB11102.1 hypothetical protein C7B62_06640 [Pleurocapsa sp. CCALA 161]
MVVKYLDPWKDDLYGKLRGDKTDAYLKITFDEAQVHKTDDAYILAAFVTAYQGVVRNFKPENPLTPGLCAVPIYGQEYEIRQKDKDGNWTGVKYQPSKFEKALYENIQTHESLWIPEGQGIKGEITFMPDGMCANMDAPTLDGLVAANSQTNPVPLTGKLPAFTPPSGNAQRKSSGKSYGLSPDERIIFIKKQLCNDLASSGFTTENSLPLLIQQMINEHPMDNDLLTIYFDTITACAR